MGVDPAQSSGGIVYEEPVDATQVRDRAIRGAGLIAVRGVAVSLLALIGGLVLARLLVPDDFGIAALGLTLLTFAHVAADAGIGPSLIRKPAALEVADLEALLAAQLLATIVITAVGAAIATQLGEIGQVTAVMLVALPFLALRTPGLVLLERKLSYGVVATIEVVEAVLYYAVAITAAALGFGVWSLVAGVIARAITGSCLLFAASGAARLRPRLSLHRVRALVGFGVRFQAVGVSYFLRDQALIVGTAAIAGMATLGLWAVARRILDAPLLLLGSLWRVSYPATSRLVATGEDVRRPIENALALSAVTLGALLVPLAAGAPLLVDELLGEQWSGVAIVITLACAALVISGPISVAASGFLWAIGEAGLLARTAALSSLLWVGVAFSLLPVLGVAALGVGWLLEAGMQALVLGRALRLRLGLGIFATSGGPTLAALAIGGAAWGLIEAGSAGLGAALAVLAVGETAYLGWLYLERRALLRQLGVVVRDATRKKGRAPGMVPPPEPAYAGYDPLVGRQARSAKRR